ncbi:hypothetical protein [Sulfurivermis fontis]|jgi:hypothetical protein|uniref:hypothetical protein n=1 Tax=Sulfurivermis fontis TaxID=1972068 RepID=UPI000FD9A90D|nr:hypothetical protein [Sulfurivermis fontis]
MNARIVFFLTLAFGLLNLVFGVISLLSTPDGWLIAHFVLAVLSIIALLPIAAMAWPGVVKLNGDWACGDRCIREHHGFRWEQHSGYGGYDD